MGHTVSASVVYSSRVGWAMFTLRRSVLRSHYIVLASICLLLGSCAQQQIEYQSSGFNRAIEQTTNDLLLLNIVRSSKDLPIFFTKLTRFSGGNMVSGTVAPKFPFGPKAVPVYDLGISANLNPGVHSMEFADLNQDEGLGGLRTPVPLHIFDQYIQAKSPWMVVTTILFDGFEVSRPINEALIKTHQEFCVLHPSNRLCEYIDRIKARCRDWISTAAVPFIDAKYGAFVPHTNSGKTECDYLKFQSFLTLLTISGFVSESQIISSPPADMEKTKAKPKTKGKLNEPSDQEVGRKSRILLSIRFVNSRHANAASVAADKALRKHARPGMAPLMRSPKRMIEFLGELTALQNYASPPYEPITLVEAAQSFEYVRLFHLVRGKEGSRNAALRVQDPQTREMFIVPQPDLGSQTRDQSLVVLSLVNDLVNLSTKKDAYPVPTALEVRTIN